MQTLRDILECLSSIQETLKNFNFKSISEKSVNDLERHIENAQKVIDEVIIIIIIIHVCL